MTDFYTLLKQSIVARGITDSGQRQAIYAQARSALIRQLASAQPKMSNADIAARVIELDRTMRQIEKELALELPAPSPTRVARDAPEASEAAYAEAPPVEREATGWDVRDRAVEDAESAVETEPEDAVREGRTWQPARTPGRAAVARRGFTPPPVPAEDENELPPPLPFRDQWNEEEAVLRDDGRAEEKPPQVARRRLPPPQRRLGWTLSERDKVRVLVGAIGALALVLIGLLVYLLLPGRGGGVTLPTNPVGAVSDAATAERIAAATLDVKQSFVVFDGHDPTVFQASSDNPVRFDSDSGGGFARVGTSAASSGVKVQIGPGLADRLAGQNIRVVVTARESVERGALNVRMAYQSGVALSHWQTANLSPAYDAIGMTWIVPQMRTSPNGADYLIIEPGIPGDNTAADIKSIRIDMLGSAPTG